MNQFYDQDPKNDPDYLDPTELDDKEKKEIVIVAIIMAIVGGGLVLVGHYILPLIP